MSIAFSQSTFSVIPKFPRTTMASSQKLNIYIYKTLLAAGSSRLEASLLSSSNTPVPEL
jgi:hypothetical protein